MQQSLRRSVFLVRWEWLSAFGRATPADLAHTTSVNSITSKKTINATSLFELEANDQGKLYEFESLSVENFWELQMPKAANPNLDFSTIVDVLLPMEYTTLQNSTYREQMIQQLDRTFSADRAYSFKNEFAE